MENFLELSVKVCQNGVKRQGEVMEIHEYQVKKLFAKHGLPVLKGAVAYTPDEAVRVAGQIGSDLWALKAQIHDGCRCRGFFVEDDAGKGTGLRFAESLDEVRDIAHQMLGHTLITPTTHHKGHEVKKIYIEEVIDIEESFDLSIQIDCDSEKVLLVLIKEDGTRKSYELGAKGVSVFQMHRLSNRMKLKPKTAFQLIPIINHMYDIFKTYKATAVEITPLALDKKGDLIALDGRIVFDPDALFEFPEISALREIDAGTEREAVARQHNFKYTKLGGNIACIVNGSGLGNATIDLVGDKGGAVSCLLDVGTEPTKEVVALAFRMVLSEPDIEGVLVNIFGGITRCDVIAQGLISASHEISVGLPLVVRMDGTNAAVGTRLLQESKLPFETISDMGKAVERIVTRVGEIV